MSKHVRAKTWVKTCSNVPNTIAIGSEEKHKKLVRSSNYKVLAAVLFAAGLFSSPFLLPHDAPFTDAAMLICVVGTMASWFLGLIDYVTSKGYSSCYGFLSLVGPLGLILLVALPSKWIYDVPPVQTPYPFPNPIQQGSLF